jgi:hypothetical protein
VTNDLERALFYLGARYPLGANERMTCEPGRGSPRFALARTRHGCIWRFRSDVAPAVSRALAKFAARESAIEEPALDAPPERLMPMRRALDGGVGEARFDRLLLYGPSCFPSAEALALETRPTDSGANTAPSAPSLLGGDPVLGEGRDALEYEAHGAVPWGDAAAIERIEACARRIYGDLVLMY